MRWWYIESQSDVQWEEKRAREGLGAVGSSSFSAACIMTRYVTMTSTFYSLLFFSSTYSDCCCCLLTLLLYAHTRMDVSCIYAHIKEYKEQLCMGRQRRSRWWWWDLWWCSSVTGKMDAIASALVSHDARNENGGFLELSHLFFQFFLNTIKCFFAM
jgi:hypothetical protein